MISKIEEARYLKCMEEVIKKIKELTPEEDNKLNSTTQGWECPRCRTIHAPWVQACNCNKQPDDQLPGDGIRYPRYPYGTYFRVTPDSTLHY